MKQIFLLTSILLLSASWALAQYGSGSSATDQNTSDSQSTGAYSGSSSQTSTTTDDVSPGAQPSSSSDSFDQSSQSSSSVQSSSDQSAPQSGGGYTSQSTRGESMSSQQGETSSDMTSQSSASTSRRLKTIQGCLSEENGKFHLTDKMGTSYELTGKTANLKAHVGHKVSVTGKVSTSGMSGAMMSSENQPGAMSGEQAGMEQTIRVSSFRHISTSCNTSMHTHPTQ